MTNPYKDFKNVTTQGERVFLRGTQFPIRQLLAELTETVEPCSEFIEDFDLDPEVVADFLEELSVFVRGFSQNKLLNKKNEEESA